MDRRTLLKALSASLATASATPAFAQARTGRLLVVVGPHSPLKDMGLADLRRVFSGELVEDAKGTKLIPLNHPVRAPDRVRFDRRVLDRSPEDVSKFWIDRRIRGQSGPPRTVTSLAILIGVVSRLPGAIGYLDAHYLSGDVRALTISGTAPSSSNYKLIYAE